MFVDRLNKKEFMGMKELLCLGLACPTFSFYFLRNLIGDEFSSLKAERIVALLHYQKAIVNLMIL